MSAINIVIHRHQKQIFVAANHSDSAEIIEFKTLGIISDDPAAKRYIPEQHISQSDVLMSEGIFMPSGPGSLKMFYCHDDIPTWLACFKPTFTNLFDATLFDQQSLADGTPTPSMILNSSVLLEIIIKHCVEQCVEKLGITLMGLGPCFNVYFTTQNSDDLKLFKKNANAIQDIINNIEQGHTRINNIPLSSLLLHHLENQHEAPSSGQVFLITDNVITLLNHDKTGLSLANLNGIRSSVYHHLLPEKLQSLLRDKIGFSKMDFSTQALISTIQEGKLPFVPVHSKTDLANDLSSIYEEISEDALSTLMEDSLQSELFLKDVVVMQMGEITKPFAEFFAKKLTEYRSLLFKQRGIRDTNTWVFPSSTQEVAKQALSLVMTQ